MHLRHRHRQTRLVARIAALPDQTTTGPEETVVDGADVRAALAQLPLRDQEVLRLTAWEGLATAQAAEVLACSRIAVRTRLHRARRRLARLLDVPDDPTERSTATRSAFSARSMQGEG
jgi:RNA polymerase sigma factor (sigma-70 family)